MVLYMMKNIYDLRSFPLAIAIDKCVYSLIKENTMIKATLFISFLFASFYFTTAQELKATDDSASVKVYVHEDGKPNSIGETVIFESRKNKVKYEVVTGSNGFAYVLLPEGETFDISYQDFFTEQDYAVLEVPSENGLIYYEVEVIYTPATVFKLENVYFDFGKATLRPESYTALNELANMLKAKPKITIEIGGHTDNVGDDQSNLTLSQNRAESVRAYLINKGISGSRMTAKGYGESKPVASNDTDEGRQQNRRTEVKILSR